MSVIEISNLRIYCTILWWKGWRLSTLESAKRHFKGDREEICSLLLVHTFTWHLRSLWVEVMMKKLTCGLLESLFTRLSLGRHLSRANIMPILSITSSRDNHYLIRMFGTSLASLSRISPLACSNLKTRDCQPRRLWSIFGSLQIVVLGS